MVANANKSNAVREATPAAAKTLHLEYNRPLHIFYPTTVVFLMLNYLAFCTTTDETGTKRLLPDYIAPYAASRTYMREASATGAAAEESAMMNVLLFFEETVIDFMFQLGIRWYRSIFGIQVVCIASWFVHIFELGVCTHMCYSCNATLGTMLLYMVCTALAGFTQLVPLTAAKNAWVKKVKAAGEAAEDIPTEESKKDK